MADNKITAVLFDWDFTLARVSGNTSTSELLEALFQQEGVAYASGEVEAALQSYEEDARQGKVREVNTPQTRRDIINFYSQILKRMGHADQIRTLANRLYSAYAYLPITLYEDSLATLRALKQKGRLLGIISNHSISARALMEERLTDFIPPHHILISQEVGIHKPAKSIFRRAAARLHTPPVNCMFVGDNLVVDAIGAVQQGEYSMGLWLDRQGRGVDQVLPDRVRRITSLYEVLGFV
jgi:FMN phosphatase YigB (HAD superfamily)